MRRKDFFLKWGRYGQYQFLLVVFLLLTISLVSLIDMEHANGSDSTSPFEPGFKELTANATRFRFDKEMNGSVHINESSAEIDAFFFILPDDNFFKRYEMWLYIERTSEDNGSIFVHYVDENNNHFEQDSVINGTEEKHLDFFRDTVGSKKIFIFIQGEGNYTVNMHKKTHPPKTLLLSYLSLIVIILISWVLIFILGIIFLTLIGYRYIKIKIEKDIRTTVRSKKDYNRFILGRKKILQKKRLLLILQWIPITALYLIISLLICLNVLLDDYLWLRLFFYLLLILFFSVLFIILLSIYLFYYQYDEKNKDFMMDQFYKISNIYDNINNDENIIEVIMTYRFIPLILLLTFPTFFIMTDLSFSGFLFIISSLILIFINCSALFFGFLMYMYLSRFTIMVTDRSIEYYWGFRSINGTISIKRKKIEINNIRSINPELYSMPIFDYKTNFYGPKFENFYLISSLLTVKIITKDHNIFYLRSNDPMRIVNFVRKRLT